MFTVVVVPLTVKSPAIVTSLPVDKSPLAVIVKAVTSPEEAFEVLIIVDCPTIFANIWLSVPSWYIWKSSPLPAKNLLPSVT